MSLQIIGPGFGRTGTRSLKAALELLGFGPCHHMQTLFSDPTQLAFWKTLAAGGTVDWQEVFADFQSQIDWPGAHVWRELLQAFPEARVVFSTRPAEAWWNSYARTVGKLRRLYPTLPVQANVTETLDTMKQVMICRGIDPEMNNREVAIAAFHRQHAEVRAAVPPERLLVFAIGDGWTPLCNFLKVPVPDTLFPSLNDSGDFWSRFGGEPTQD
jgi:hypothetical protein